MSRIVIIEEPATYAVWIGLEDSSSVIAPPEGFSFVIGVGMTRDEAVAAAVQDLEAAIETLQAPVLGEA